METPVSEWKLPWEGGCRCGKVRFRVTQPPLLTMACHCTGCQRMSSSAYSLSMAVWMFTRPEGMDFFVNVRPSMLDDWSWFVPFVETYTEAKRPWAAMGAVHSFPQLPEMSAYEAKGARPK